MTAQMATLEQRSDNWAKETRGAQEKERYLEQLAAALENASAPDSGTDAENVDLVPKPIANLSGGEAAYREAAVILRPSPIDVDLGLLMNDLRGSNYW